MMQAEQVTDHIVGWLNNYHKTSGTKGFIVGISGGIDSAVTASLCARTGHPLLCVEMPIHQEPSQVRRGHQHILKLKQEFPNVAHSCFDLSETFDHFAVSVPDGFASDIMDMPLVNVRARLRMTALYYLASVRHSIVVGTGNKIEDFGIGFFTKYGDGGVDLSPIADLTKSQVYQLGAYLNVNKDIMTAPPTDGLWADNRSDEDQIGASYEELEWAMGWTEKHDDKEGMLTVRQKEVLSIYQRLNKKMQHKMNPIPVCEIPEELLSNN